MERACLLCAVVAMTCALPVKAQEQSPAKLASRTPEQVVKHHLAVFTQHDLEGILSDYADDAIFIAAKQTVQGKPALRKMFESFIANSKGNAAAPAFEATVTAEGDVGYEHWVSNPGKPGSMAGTDAFVVRHGKIVFHTVVGVHAVDGDQK